MCRPALHAYALAAVAPALFAWLLLPGGSGVADPASVAGLLGAIAGVGLVRGRRLELHGGVLYRRSALRRWKSPVRLADVTDAYYVEQIPLLAAVLDELQIKLAWGDVDLMPGWWDRGALLRAEVLRQLGATARTGARDEPDDHLDLEVLSGGWAATPWRWVLPLGWLAFYAVMLGPVEAAESGEPLVVQIPFAAGAVIASTLVLGLAPFRARSAPTLSALAAVAILVVAALDVVRGKPGIAAMEAAAVAPLLLLSLHMRLRLDPGDEG